MFNKKQKRIKVLEAEVKKISEWYEEAVTTIGNLQKTHEEDMTAVGNLQNTNSELAKQLEVKDHQGSVVPWFQLETTELDPVKGLQIKLDWNEAMIQHLRDNGHTGRDDEVLVQKWLAMLYEDIISQLEQKLIELNTDNKDHSEFE